MELARTGIAGKLNEVEEMNCYDFIDIYRSILKQGANEYWATKEASKR